ncbi:MAG: EF2563 family selenium-dependent molybdenum hydroxylase system protein [Anaerolineales bacterium]|nr:MAG: EF2563 family selenium-dependent molybdenum hydroxylase system protein [Anaerolineales bacterium]
MTAQRPLVLIRGGGDLASGVALRLHRSHYPVVIAEIPQPLAVRRAVAFSEAIYQGTWEIEGIRAQRVEGEAALYATLLEGQIPVIIDPDADLRHKLQILALVDGRMLKRPPELDHTAAALVVGLGPGFTAGVDCHAVIETQRGHHLGRVYWQGSAQTNTGIPEVVAGFDVQRVIRSPEAGLLHNGRSIGVVIEAGETIAEVGRTPVLAEFKGALRGLLHDGVMVHAGQKIGDLDPRANPSYCFTVSEKALAVAGGVLEAFLTCEKLPLVEA